MKVIVELNVNIPKLARYAVETRRNTEACVAELVRAELAFAFHEKTNGIRVAAVKVCRGGEPVYKDVSMEEMLKRKCGPRRIVGRVRAGNRNGMKEQQDEQY